MAASVNMPLAKMRAKEFLSGMDEIGKQRQINVKNRYKEEPDLGFSKMRWVLEILKMHCSKIEIEIIKNLLIRLLTILNEES